MVRSTPATLCSPETRRKRDFGYGVGNGGYGRTSRALAHLLEHRGSKAWPRATATSTARRPGSLTSTTRRFTAREDKRGGGIEAVAPSESVGVIDTSWEGVM